MSIEGHDDVFIPKNNVNGAFSGDTVLIQVRYEYDDELKSEGDVIRIIERGAHTIVGTFKRGQGFNLIISDNPNDTKITLSNLSNTPPCPGIKLE